MELYGTQDLDSIIGTATRIPRLLGADGFSEWKWRFEQYVKGKDAKIWRSIICGPTRITVTLDDAAKTMVDKELEDYTDDDFEKVEHDEKSLATITMALPPDIAQGFREYTTAKALWNALIKVYEGNEDMIQSRQDRLHQRFNSFNHIIGQSFRNFDSSMELYGTQDLDSIIGTATRVPRLLGADGFSEWKWRFEQYVKGMDAKIWRSIIRGPTRITVTLDDAAKTVVDKELEDYTDDDFEKVEQDEKSLATITMALAPDITQGFREYTNAKALWNALIEVYEGNEDMIQSRHDRLHQRFNSFNHIIGESLETQLQREIL